jgi:hypothetical protein
VAHASARIVSERFSVEKGAGIMAVSTNARKTLDAFVSAFNDGDADAVLALFASSGDVLGIGTDPKEWWLGRATLDPVLVAQLREMGGAQFHVEETAGSDRWLACRCSIGLPGGPGFPARLTMVYSADHLIEHFHLSIGVANEEVVGQTLTT